MWDLHGCIRIHDRLKRRVKQSTDSMHDIEHFQALAIREVECFSAQFGVFRKPLAEQQLYVHCIFNVKKITGEPSVGAKNRSLAPHDAVDHSRYQAGKIEVMAAKIVTAACDSHRKVEN